MFLFVHSLRFLVEHFPYPFIQRRRIEERKQLVYLLDGKRPQVVKVAVARTQIDGIQESLLGDGHCHAAPLFDAFLSDPDLWVYLPEAIGLSINIHFTAEVADTGYGVVPLEHHASPAQHILQRTPFLGFPISFPICLSVNSKFYYFVFSVHKNTNYFNTHNVSMKLFTLFVSPASL